MQNFSLKVLFKIVGVGAASGLVYHQNSLFLISDSSSFLYEYNIEKAVIIRIPLQEYGQDNIPKQDKLDFEAITLQDNRLYVFGSGSTKKREIRYTYDLLNHRVTATDFAEVCQKIKKAAGISSADLNIEGVFFKNDKWYFFQRGNGENSKNGIVILNQNTNEVEFAAIQLPKINSVEATFTDAILVGETIYFLAAAENTTSTYEDGEVVGSLIGSLQLATLQLKTTAQITTNKKFEGLTFYKESETTISFLLCEDNDTETLQSDIYELKLQK